jgi:hypothetical protein
LSWRWPPHRQSRHSCAVLFHSDARQPSITLVLTRQRSALTAQIDGLETVAATKWLTADAEIRFTVRETANQKIVLYLPALDGFALKEGDKVRKQARYRDILVDGQRLETSPRTTLPFEVDAHRGRPVVLAIRGIEDAGEYSGTIRLSSADGSPVTKDVTVLVKTSIWVAAFWIFLGVLASFLMRRYTKEQRPKLQALRRTRYAESDLAAVETNAGALHSPADAVVAGRRARLSGIERSLDDGTARDGAATDLTELEAKIRTLPTARTTRGFAP